LIVSKGWPRKKNDEFDAKYDANSFGS
jgi:hypothetical protein